MTRIVETEASDVRSRVGGDERRDAEGRRRSIPLSTRRASPSRVLLVDDSAPLVQCLAEVLRGAGLDAIAVTSAPAAIELASRLSFDAVVVDLEMPEIDGARALQELRALAPRAVRFLMTGSTDEMHIATLSPVVRSVLRKPFAPDMLVEALLEAGLGPASYPSLQT